MRMANSSEGERTVVTEESGPRRVDLTCENCNAPVQWDPEADALSCEFCGHQMVVPRGEGTIVERPLADADKAARGFGLEQRVTVCENCSARVTFEESSTATQCVFCGSANVLAQDANRNSIRPESLVPLDIGEKTVRASFEDWIKGLWFRPNALKETRDFRAIGVYVPVWTFDARVHSDWSADSGTYYYVKQSYTVRVNGRSQVRTRTVRKTRWRPAWGQRDDVYDDLQIIASRGVPADLAAKLGPFDTSELVAYRPEYLAGWRAEEYQIDLESGWNEGVQRVEARQRERCAGDVPGDTYRRLGVENKIEDVRWKHVLLPMWSLTYTHKDKPYAVLIHGQNGRIAGDAPYSGWKILGLVLVIAAIILVIVFAAGGV